MKKVLYVSSEARPFIASGGLADVVGSLPFAFDKKKIQVSVVLPFYSSISANYESKIKLIDSRIVNLDWRQQQAYLHKTNHNGIDFYFIDCAYYFGRTALYGENDDCERFSFFCSAVVDFLGDKFDIIHCHDWQTALIPALLVSKGLKAKTVLTVHNLAYQGKFNTQHLQDITGLESNFNGVFEWNGCNNLLKGGIVMCNALTTVSPTYAEEIKTHERGEGLADIISSNKGKLTGILNGIDYNIYNSAEDKEIAANFDINSLDKKAVCKKALQKEMGLPESNAPIFAMVTRFAHHKGIDLVSGCINNLLKRNLQFVVLGDGDSNTASFFKDIAKKNPNFAVFVGFNNGLAKKIYSGADFFVMPSGAEPCGLAQMIACRYATIPIVRSVGGLKDSIRNLKNGLSFLQYSSPELENSINKALTLYSNPDLLIKMRQNCLSTDFSWDKSAAEYTKLYEKL